MNAYELRTEGDDFKAYLLDDAALDAVDAFFGRPSEGLWRPFRVSADRQNKRVPAGDFPCIFISQMPAMSLRAVDALRDLLEPVGELLPVESPDGPLWLYNCLRFADVLDEDRSEIRRFPDGDLAQIYRHAWKPALEAETLFRLTRLSKSSVYVTDVVVERIRSAGLVGYRFVG